MAQQVKFYSVPASAATTDANGIYFKDDGHLYKGTSRFGANKVFIVASEADLNVDAAITAGKVEGDIAIGYGSARVWDGTQWLPLENINQQKALVSLMVSGLAVGNSNSYITNITQDANGNVKAEAKPFPSINLESASKSGTGNGITVSVTTESGAVTGVQVSASQISCESVSATSGTFTNLVVASTATFSVTDVSAGTLVASTATFSDITVNGTASFVATTVSADTLTIGGKSVAQIADERIAAISQSYSSGTNNGVYVSVTTSAGKVTGVVVSAPEIVTSIASAGSASTSKVASEKAVRDALSNFDNAMHFRGVFASTANVTNPVGGDIVIIGANPSPGAATGQEYIYNDQVQPSIWELIGDQNAVTGGTSSSTVNGVTATVVTAAGTAAPSVTLSGIGTAASYDATNAIDTDHPDVLVTAGAVNDWVDAAIGTAIQNLQASVSASDKGVVVGVVEENGVLTSATVSVTAASTMAFGASGSANELATTAAIKSFYDNNLVWLNASGNVIS